MKTWKDIEEEQYSERVELVKSATVSLLYHYRGKVVEDHYLKSVQSRISKQALPMISEEATISIINQYLVHANIDTEIKPFYHNWKGETKSGTYVLQLEGGFYYVGKSDDLLNRWKSHQEGTGSEWTKKHKPLGVISVTDKDEDSVVLNLMKDKGVLMVRGGSFSSPSINKQTLRIIENMIATKFNLCHKCMKEGHYANQCKEKGSVKR